MRTLLFFLALVGASLCTKEITADAFCKVWSGWGMGFTGKECSDSIMISCTSLMSIIPKLILFFEHFDINRIIEIYNMCLEVYHQLLKQFHLCDYDNVLYNLISHLIVFFNNFIANMLKIYEDLGCVLRKYQAREYFECGVCIGKVFKIIFDS